MKPLFALPNMQALLERLSADSDGRIRTDTLDRRRRRIIARASADTGGERIVFTVYLVHDRYVCERVRTNKAGAYSIEARSVEKIHDWGVSLSGVCDSSTLQALVDELCRRFRASTQEQDS